MTKTFNIYEILSTIPHRYPFIMVDKVLSIEHGKCIHAIKNVTANEPYFAGHYPQQPIMPGVLIVEALAQSAALLVLTDPSKEPQEGFVPLFAGVDNVRFKRKVIPGDQLHLHISITRYKQGIWKMHAEAIVDEDVACIADLTTAFREINSD
jgi:3-hydroxyacyl-[acyl-carrier-protein] dehydratase